MSLALQRLVRARQNNMDFPLAPPFGATGAPFMNIPLYSVLGPLPISLGVAATDSSVVVQTDALSGIVDGGILNI